MLYGRRNTAAFGAGKSEEQARQTRIEELTGLWEVRVARSRRYRTFGARHLRRSRVTIGLTMENLNAMVSDPLCRASNENEWMGKIPAWG